MLDFEYIEMPKVEESGGFTEINSPYIKSNKKEEKESYEQNNQNNMLFNYFNSRASQIKNSLNNNYFNFFKKDKNKNDEDASNRSCINLGSLGIKKKNYKLLKAMAVLKSSNYQTWKDNFKSLVSTLYYNGYGLSKTFDKESPIFPLYVFDVKIKDVIADEINLLLKSFLYMSYRSGFINLNNNGCGDYTSDCGWGCMLRCSQMILSKGLIKKKEFDYFQKENTKIENEFMDAKRKETLCLFNDNYLNYKDIESHPDFKNFWKLYKELVDTNPEYNSICEIIPPYSIHILCKLGKCAGEYTSFVKLVKIFSKINTNLFNDINIIFFECGYISKKKLYSYFCEEYTEFDDNYFETDTYNNVDYIFKKGGIVFISFRLGLYNNIDSTYIKVIPKLFEKFNNNLGFVSGKKDRAYYFIGVQNDKLIFVDPHYNQQTTNNSDKDYESYYTENLYLLDYKDLSSELTIGIAIFNMTQFKQFLNDLNWFNKNYKDINLISLD
jgi:cysteine protease ATG4